MRRDATKPIGSLHDGDAPTRTLMRLGYPVGAHMIFMKQLHRVLLAIPERNEIRTIEDPRLRFGIHKTSTAKAKENVERRHTFSRFMVQIGSAYI